MIDMTGITAHQAAEIGEVYFLRAEFASGTMYVCTAGVPLSWGGNTWLPVGNTLTLSGVAESMQGTDKMIAELGIVDVAMLQYLTGSASVYRNRAIEVSLALCNPVTFEVLAVRSRWVGRMDQVKVERSNVAFDTGGDSSGKIVLSSVRAGSQRSRRDRGARLTNEQHQGAYPGDTGLRYVRGLIQSPATWLSKKFQEQT
jgi:hypothetical protein